MFSKVKRLEGLVLKLHRLMKTLRNLSLYADKIVNSALSEYRRNKVSKDDVLDGLQQQSPQKLGKDTGLNTRPVSPKKMLKG